MKKRAGTVFESAYIFHFQWCLAMNSGKSSSWQCMYFSFLVASGNEKEQVQFLAVHIFSFPVASGNGEKPGQYLAVHIFSFPVASGNEKE
jgi:hypothetical protein